MDAGQLRQKNLVNPINSIIKASQDYISERHNSEKRHFADLEIHTGDELENLIYNLGKMEKELSHYEQNLMKITAEKERINIEVSLATKIQASMLPHIFPPYPHRHEFDIYASMNPAKEVGGDFYDFFLVDDNHLAIIMADVSGKGIPAALFMMASKILISNYTMMDFSPHEILEHANETICKSNEMKMFVTVWMGILEISTGKVVAANAGHEYPVLRQPDGKFELFKDKHGFVIGGIKGRKYNEYEFTMQKGSTLFLYTDGVPEATNVNDELFGTKRLVETLNQNLGQHLNNY